MKEQIQKLLESGLIASEPAPDDEISDLWSGAVEAYADAVENRYPNRRLLAAYDAARLTALVLLRAADLRVRAQNHHELTFAVAALLAGDDLADLLNLFEPLRLERSKIEYGRRVRAPKVDLEPLLPRLRELLERGRIVLIRLKPDLQARLLPAP
jgi:hypothetical protein